MARDTGEVGEVLRDQARADVDLAPRVVLQLPAARVRLWEPGDPHLYRLRLELLDGAGTVVDAAASYAGLRSVSIDGLHQKVFEERYLFHADRLGYLVWAEFGDWGAAGGGREGDNQQPTASFVTQWLEAVDRDYSHPCIIGWCPHPSGMTCRGPPVWPTANAPRVARQHLLRRTTCLPPDPPQDMDAVAFLQAGAGAGRLVQTSQRSQ